MTRICAAILLVLPVVLGQTRPQTVLFAAHRAGSVEVLDPITLQSLGSIKVLPQDNGVTSDRTGVLFLREGIAPEFQGCCALYAVDLKTREITKLLEPVSEPTVSPDGQHVVTQRGNVGIEAFDVHTLHRESPIPRSIAPGVYTLSFSPDGRLLFGVSNFPMPFLDVLINPIGCPVRTPAPYRPKGRISFGCGLGICIAQTKYTPANRANSS